MKFRLWLSAAFVYALLINATLTLHLAFFILYPAFIQTHIFSVPLYLPISVTDSVMLIFWMLPYRELYLVLKK